jgi:hypothetical protein
VTSLLSSKQRPEVRAEDAPLRALLGSLIDYAGLFPPAGLDVAAAARAYDSYRRSEHAWMLGAFVVPLAKLPDLAAAAPSATWPVSVLVPSFDALATGFAHEFDQRFDVHAVEVAPQEPAAIRSPRSGMVGADGVRIFYEVLLDDRMEARLDAIAAAGATAKVRTGGVVPDAFPSAARLAEFIHGCAERGLAFKATAGLHHPTRGRYALTYEPGCASAEMFGFLDVALVAELLRSRRVDTYEAALLLRDRAGSVVCAADEIHWQGHRFSTMQIRELRGRFFLSFGSCSFEDPVSDLEGIGLL